mmetsp:Transcript_5250/g.15694  ORF Transcript_5250/g.15694 Transcript_5250/m.15694 type:complete len:200 (-) Transcript_5250:121-720(-)
MGSTRETSAQLSEFDKMISGIEYDPMTPHLTEMREKAHGFCWRFNNTEKREDRFRIIQELGLKFPKDAPPHVEPTFNCDYGFNITLGKGFYCNFNCVILDCAPVTFGDNCFLGPAVQIYTASHPLEAMQRRTWLERATKVKIGDDCWLGGACIVCPGVTIGDRVVVGAGTVVTKDVPSDVVVAGSPARIIRPLEPPLQM